MRFPAPTPLPRRDRASARNADQYDDGASPIRPRLSSRIQQTAAVAPRSGRGRRSMGPWGPLPGRNLSNQIVSSAEVWLDVAAAGELGDGRASHGDGGDHEADLRYFSSRRPLTWHHESTARPGSSHSRRPRATTIHPMSPQSGRRPVGATSGDLGTGSRENDGFRALGPHDQVGAEAVRIEDGRGRRSAVGVDEGRPRDGELPPVVAGGQGCRTRSRLESSSVGGRHRTWPERRSAWPAARGSASTS